MILYLDSSALVKWYVKETFSEGVSPDMVFACFDDHLNRAAVAQTMKVL